MNKKKAEMERKIEIIKKFAKDMGYTYGAHTYKDYFDNKRPCFCISLEETEDGDGNPYGWAWHTDTYDEIKECD